MCHVLASLRPYVYRLRGRVHVENWLEFSALSPHCRSYHGLQPLISHRSPANIWPISGQNSTMKCPPPPPSPATTASISVHPSHHRCFPSRESELAENSRGAQRGLGWARHAPGCRRCVPGAGGRGRATSDRPEGSACLASSHGLVTVAEPGYQRCVVSLKLCSQIHVFL
jgi:hypothetical protein